MPHDTPTRTCPMCNHPIERTPAELLKLHKISINARLNALTNPPQVFNEFLRQARDILGEYELSSILDDFNGWTPFYNNDNTIPGDQRILVSHPWNCYLTLQWCYGKIEVAYLS